MMNLIKHNSRAFFYAVIISLGIVFLMNIEVNKPNLYSASVIIIYIIILFEMYYIWFISKEKLKQLDLPLISGYTKAKEFIHHLILPSFLYFSIVGFIFFNNDSNVRIPLVVITFIAFTALFINLKAFYLDKFDLEKKTYFVYDLIELIVFFTATNIIINSGVYLSLDILIVVLFITALTFTLLFLNLYQFDEVKIFPILITIFFSVLSGVHFYLVSNQMNLTILPLSALQFLLYYLLFGVIRHKIDGTLSMKVLVEYLSVFILSLAVLIGVSS